jgi:hypothetical protein
MIFIVGQDDLTAVVWREEHDIYILTYMHSLPTNGDEHGNAIKPRIIQDYN